MKNLALVLVVLAAGVAAYLMFSPREVSAPPPVVAEPVALPAPTPDPEATCAKPLGAAKAARERGDDALAATSYRDALAACPANAEAKARLAELAIKAKDLYMQGYVTKTTDPAKARALFAQVVALTAPDDEFHQKAAVRIQELDGR